MQSFVQLISPTSSTKVQLESLIEHFIQTLTKTNEALGEAVTQLNSKFAAISTHQKIMEN